MGCAGEAGKEWVVKVHCDEGLATRIGPEPCAWSREGRREAPRPTILHPWPDARFDRHHPSRQPGAVVPHAGFCPGGAG